MYYGDNLNQKVVDIIIMNTNVIEYLMKVKKMTQVEIAGELNSNSDDPDKKGITQAAISKWRKGLSKIPLSRQVELLKLAGLYWEIEAIDKEDPDNSISVRELDSNWNVLIQSEENQFLWVGYISELHPSFEIVNGNGSFLEDEYFCFIRKLLLTLNNHGFSIPPRPPISSKFSRAEQQKFDNFFRMLLLRINILQTWCISSLPRKFLHGYLELYILLPRIAIAQTVMQSLKRNHLPLGRDIMRIEQSIKTTDLSLRIHIDNWLHWAKKYSYALVQESFDEILIPNVETPYPYEQPKAVNADNKLSYGEKKILEGIEKNEKLLNEILKRLDEK